MSAPPVITGSAMITSVGADKQTSFAALCDGHSGNGRLRAFPAEKFTTRHAYEIQDRPPDGSDEAGRATRWLCAAIQQAIDEAKLAGDAGRIAVLIGTGLRELRSLELWWADGVPLTVDQLHFGGAVRRATGLRAPVFTFSNACSASSFALGLGADLLELEEADTVIVGGCDSITETMYGLLDRVNPQHPEIVQPFDQNRRGVLMGEGAAAVVLEPVARARNRCAAIQAHVRGVGLTCDAFHVTAPAHTGIVCAIRDAHARARIPPEAVDLLLLHGTGTFLNDEVEAEAIATVFGDCLSSIPLTAIKSMTGHTSGASALVGVVTAIESMRQQRIPPTANLHTPIARSAGCDFVTAAARHARPQISQVNAFGFGGVNGVVILEGASV
jgi:3-oxoacyl-[acyl-carrier-protein] synthase II